MYKVLYRKYRPKRFEDVVGQPQVTVTLKNELKNNRISHAYLFTGTRGTGKTSCAKILAKAVNCLNLIDGDACGECEVCRGVDDGSLLDVVEIDAASNNGVENIRALIEESNFTPTSAKYRVYIIDEVHMLSVAAFNALLKTLEEPPAHVIFILATTEVHRLLPTILSRCQRFPFRRITPEDVADCLDYIASQEGAEIERDAALLIARITDGTMRDAISVLDQCLSRNSLVTAEVVNEAVGIANRDYLFTCAKAVLEGNGADALEVIDTLYKNAKDMNRLCEEMAEYFRGLMIIKTMKKPESVLNVSAQELEAMREQAAAMPLPVIIHGLNTFEETLNKMRFSNARTEIEIVFVKLCNPELDTSPEALLRRLEALEKGGVRLSSSVPYESEIKGTGCIFGEKMPEESVSSQKSTEEPRQEASANSAGDSQDLVKSLSEQATLFSDWPEILDMIRINSASTGAAFNGSAAYINGDYMLIEAPQLAFDLLKRPTQRDTVREAIRKATGRVYKLGPYVKSENTEKSKDDPLALLEQRAEALDIEIENKEE